MDLSMYREDPKKQESGTPIHVGDAEFLVRRWGTPESIKVKKEIALEVFGPLHKFTDQDESLIWGHWLCEYGVAGWEDVNDVDGKPLKYSVKRARRIFLSPEYMYSGNLNSILINSSMMYENYLYDQAEEVSELLKK